MAVLLQKCYHGQEGGPVGTGELSIVSGRKNSCLM